MVIHNKYEFEKVYKGSVEELQEELQDVTLENIKRYKPYKEKIDDFYSMWLRFGPEAARTILIPYIWRGDFPSPREVR